MGYALPAAIGAAIYNPDRQIISINGDGGTQLNLQELQTMKFHNLNIKLIIFNNFGYGIIKQFQDSYSSGRHHATGEGYSQPDFEKVSEAYGIKFHRVEEIEDLRRELFLSKGPAVIEIRLHPDTMIEPKLEVGRSLEDQFPYLSDEEFNSAMKFGVNTRKENPQKKATTEV